MPGTIEVNGNLLNLSPALRYQHVGGDAVYAAENQGVNGISDERVVKEGDWIDSPNHVIVTSVGTAQLAQYSPSEPDPPEKPKAKPKKK